MEQALPYRTTTDETLVERIQAGESSLYEVLVDRYHSPLCRLITGVLRGDGESEDVVQEAHLRAFTRLHQFRGEARFSTWFHRIAVNQALQYRRSSWRMQYVGDSWPAECPAAWPQPLSQCSDPERLAAAEETRAALDTALESLRPILRIPFVMKEVEHLRMREIATRLGITEACVRTRVHRARKELRRLLGRVAAGASARTKHHVRPTSLREAA